MNSSGQSAKQAVAAPTSASLAKDVAYVAGGAALICVCAMVTIPTGMAVPITLQTLGVTLAGAILGAKRGLLAGLLYLALGAVGLPVFAGGSAGPGVFLGASVGYLIAFPLHACVVGFAAYRIRTTSRVAQTLYLFGAILASSLVLVHGLGIVGMSLRIPASLGTAMGYDAVFIPGDLIKSAVAAVVAAGVHRALPHLLRR